MVGLGVSTGPPEARAMFDKTGAIFEEGGVAGGLMAMGLLSGMSLREGAGKLEEDGAF